MSAINSPIMSKKLSFLPSTIFSERGRCSAVWYWKKSGKVAAWIGRNCDALSMITVLNIFEISRII